jgi:hypothetical protein
MTKIDYSFTMLEAPEQALARFRDDMSGELDRKAEFTLFKEEPAKLHYTQGGDNEDFESLGPRRRGEDEVLEFGRLETSRRLTVTFASEGSGSSVRIQGHCEREIRKGLEALGTPGHWPEGREGEAEG